MSAKIIILFFGLSLFVSTGCSESPAVYMTTDNVVFLKRDFPEVTLQAPQPVDVEVPGGKKFVIQDSLMIFSLDKPDGMWRFFTLPNFENKGDYIQKGNGPNEFIFMPWVGNRDAFEYDNGNLIASIYDFQKGKIYRFNITETLANGQLCMNMMKDSIPPFLSAVVMIDSSTLIYKNITDDMRSQHRALLKNGIISTPELFEVLNSAAVPPNEDFNILATMMKWNPKHRKIVEMPLKLNYFNIYSIDGQYQKTVCLGDKLDDINRIAEQKMALRIFRNGNVRVYDDFFGILCINETEVAFDTGSKKHPSIIFFDMDGNPLIEMKLSKFATSFDIDFNSGHLYTFDYRTEEFYRYNIAQFTGKFLSGF